MNRYNTRRQLVNASGRNSVYTVCVLSTRPRAGRAGVLTNSNRDTSVTGDLDITFERLMHESTEGSRCARCIIEWGLR
jgi:hypothetical protein